MGANYFLKFNLDNLRIFDSVTIMIYIKNCPLVNYTLKKPTKI